MSKGFVLLLGAPVSNGFVLVDADALRSSEKIEICMLFTRAGISPFSLKLIGLWLGTNQDWPLPFPLDRSCDGG